MKARLKKFTLSFFVVAAFLFYSLFQRQENGPANQASGASADDSPEMADNKAILEPKSAQLPDSKPAPANQAPPSPPAPLPAKRVARPLASTTTKDGIYTGLAANAYYGKVQVEAAISGGKLTDVRLLAYPQDNQTSILINNQALPLLKAEAIKAQSDQIDIVSGATYTSSAYISSLSSALAKSQNKIIAGQSAKVIAKAPAQLPPATATPPVLPPPAIDMPPPAVSTPSAGSAYLDGQYTGAAADAYYGNVQVKAVISGGKITDVQFLIYPQDRQTSVLINSQATPILRTEAIQAQSAQVNAVSGATYTSHAFAQSLSSALSQALPPGQSSPQLQPQQQQLRPQPKSKIKAPRSLDDDYKDEEEDDDD